MTKRPFHVGIVGAGLGGLASSIAVARSGTTVTLLGRASSLVEAKRNLRDTMDFWMGRWGNIITYPISSGIEMNIVTAFYADTHVTQVDDVPVDEFQTYYLGYPHIAQKMLNWVKQTKRWPLLRILRMERWSNTKRTVVGMRDAPHAMQYRVVQRAARAKEDGLFLGQMISEVVRGEVDLEKLLWDFTRREGFRKLG